MTVLLSPSYLVAKASVSLATKLFRDYRENVFFSPGAVLILSNVRKKKRFYSPTGAGMNGNKSYYLQTCLVDFSPGSNLPNMHINLKNQKECQ
jgi:hypothetical protein